MLVGGTRVIFNEKDRESSIPVKNTGTSPYVVQAWIDPARREAKTVHHQGWGTFALDGRTITLPSDKA